MASARADIYTDDKNAAALRRAGADGDLGSWLKAHLSRTSAGDYVALLAYIERNHAHIDALQQMQVEVRNKRHVATCAEFGPRFLHSTGQAYKGGPNSGVFLQITSDDADDIAVPGHKASFGVLTPAQARADSLSKLRQAGDVITDGGNTFWQDDVRRGKALKERGIHYIDVGTSGGVWGIDRGYCMMIGGDKAVVDRLDPIFAALAPGIGDIPPTSGREGRDPRIEQGYIHAGPVGAGHFVKMVHNGIEYGLMQAYAEGFDILKNANIDALPPEHRFDFDLADIAEAWRRGSVIPSWLLDLTASALAKNPTLESYSGFVEDSGERRWTVNAAIDEAGPAEGRTAGLFARFRTLKN